MQTIFLKTTRGRWLILGVLVVLIGLSVSVRAQQVRRVFHGANQSTMTAKTDMPVQMSLDREPLPRVPDYVGPPLRQDALQPPAIETTSLPSTQTLWNSLAVQHRPPPPLFT